MSGVDVALAQFRACEWLADDMRSVHDIGTASKVLGRAAHAGRRCPRRPCRPCPSCSATLCAAGQSTPTTCQRCCIMGPQLTRHDLEPTWTMTSAFRGLTLLQAGPQTAFCKPHRDRRLLQGATQRMTASESKSEGSPCGLTAELNAAPAGLSAADGHLRGSCGCAAPWSTPAWRRCEGDGRRRPPHPVSLRPAPCPAQPTISMGACVERH